jgi:hypothetical protein
VLSLFEPGRHSELAVYSGRLSLGFVASLVGLFVCRRDARAFTLCALVAVGCLVWSAEGMGYSRYGLYLELLSGAAVVAVASLMLRGAASLKRAAAGLLLAALTAQAATACVYAWRYEWSMRHNVLHWREYRGEARFVFRDRALAPFLAEEERAKYAGVDAWLVSGWKSAGIEVLLNGRAPVISASYWEFMSNPTARRRFVESVEAVRGERFYSICFPEDLARAEADMRGRGFEVLSTEEVGVPLFSNKHRLGMVLVRLARPSDPQVFERFVSTGKAYELRDGQ